MGLDLNKNFGNTQSTKLRHEVVINSFINSLIDNDQDLKRLFRYPTLSPLSKKSTNKNGDTIIQSNLTETLTEDNSEGNQNLFYGTYNPDMETATQTYCFIHNNGSTFNVEKEGWNNSYFVLEVIIPRTYDLIQDEGLNLKIPRGDAIGIKISDLLDGYILDDKKYTTNVGNPSFHLINKTVSRLSNTSDNIVYTYVYKASVLDSRRKI